MKNDKGYRRLKIWQESHKLVIIVYKITKVFPKNETYCLVSQMRRAAISVVANIVEGHARRTNKDFLRFLYISNASLVELEYFLQLSLELGFINKEKFDKVDNQRVVVGNLLNGFIKYLRNKHVA